MNPLIQLRELANGKPPLFDTSALLGYLDPDGSTPPKHLSSSRAIERELGAIGALMSGLELGVNLLVTPNILEREYLALQRSVRAEVLARKTGVPAGEIARVFYARAGLAEALRAKKLVLSESNLVTHTAASYRDVERSLQAALSDRAISPTDSHVLATAIMLYHQNGKVSIVTQDHRIVNHWATLARRFRSAGGFRCYRRRGPDLYEESRC